MFYISRALVFIACLLAAVFVAWWVGLIGLIAAVVVIPSQSKITRHSTPATRTGGAHNG